MDIIKSAEAVVKLMKQGVIKENKTGCDKKKINHNNDKKKCANL